MIGIGNATTTTPVMLSIDVINFPSKNKDIQKAHQRKVQKRLTGNKICVEKIIHTLIS